MQNVRGDLKDAVKAAFIKIRKTKKFSESEGSCLYRGPYGRKCIAGHIIPDEKYDSIMEGKGVLNNDVIPAIESIYKDMNQSEHNFLDTAQKYHDNIAIPSNRDGIQPKDTSFSYEEFVKVSYGSE